MTTYQYDLMGNMMVAGDIVDRVRHILKNHPEARDDYRVLVARYWLEFDGLDRIIDGETFVDWIRHATSPKTAQNRAMEIQREDPDLDSTPAIRRRRDYQAKAGIVR